MRKINELVGNRIRTLRKAKKWSLEKLAEESQLHFTTIARVETNKQTPSLECIIKITDALGISLSDFFRLEATDKDKGINEIVTILKGLNLTDISLIKDQVILQDKYLKRRLFSVSSG